MCCYIKVICRLGRYPSVFWHTNKAFGLLFSLQLIVNGVHTILIITAFTILYKVSRAGAHHPHPPTRPIGGLSDIRRS